MAVNNSLVNISENGQARKGLKVNGQTSDSALDRANQDNANLAAVEVESISTRIDELRNTIVNDDDQHITGSNNNDNIATFAGDDTILSGNGNDLVLSNAGDDKIEAGNGNDIVDSGDGDDLIKAGNGNDFVLGGAGDDEIHGGNGDDVLYGEEGSDILKGGVGNDYLHGGSGNDILDGGIGDDFLVAGSGNNTVIGGIGNDTVVFEASSDNFRIDYDDSGNIVITDAINTNNVTTISGVEKFLFLSKDGEELLSKDELIEFADAMRATQGNDVLTGTNGNDVINGLAGNDTIDGGAGNDTIDGGAGNDIVDGGAGNDTIGGGFGNDIVDGGDGNDTIHGGAGNDTIAGGSGNDIISGGDGDDIVEGGTGNDTITGGSGNDIISGGDGDDIIKGGAGNDIIDAGSGNNIIEDSDGTDTVALSGKRSDYDLMVNKDTSITLTNRNSGDVNTISNVENFEFTDVTLSEKQLRDSATRDVVVVQAASRDLQTALDNWGGRQNDTWEQLTSSNDKFYQGILNSGNNYSSKGNNNNYYILDVKDGKVLGEVSDINQIQVNEGQIANVSTEGDDGLAKFSGNAKITYNNAQYNVVDVNARRSSPIVLDMDGDGIELTSAEDGVNFDINADGVTDRTAWTQSGQGFDDAFLALDRNNNGQIDHGGELFGDQHGADNGYEELAKFDSNQDGKITEKDEIYDKLSVWADKDGDGQVDDGEMKGLKDAGITSIATNYSGQVGDRFDENGNDISLTSSFTMNQDGQSVTRDTVDAFFVNKDLTNSGFVNSLNSELAQLQAELQNLVSKGNYNELEADSLKTKISNKESEITNIG
jgi:Ca2+-binding RTX toxin-like protein